MKKIVMALLIVSSALFAALPPQVQNLKDLDQMVEYVKTHKKMAATVRNIDLQNKIIYFGAECKVIFKRKTSLKPAGMVGPAEPLTVKRSTCPDD